MDEINKIEEERARQVIGGESPSLMRGLLSGCSGWYELAERARYYMVKGGRHSSECLLFVRRKPLVRPGVQ